MKKIQSVLIYGYGVMGRGVAAAVHNGLGLVPRQP
jgi:3-hydroxyacyl-CoA dehydrogenase